MLTKTTSKVLADLQDILDRVKAGFGEKGKAFPGVMIAVAQHEVNLYLQGIGFPLYVMVDCDKDLNLSLTTL